MLLKSGAYAPLFRGRVSGLAGLEKVFRRGICSPVCPVVCAWYDPPLSPPHPGARDQRLPPSYSGAPSLVLWAGVSQAPPSSAQIGSREPDNRAC